METIACTLCEKELSGGLDTFGPLETPLCWDCWTDQPVKRAEEEAVARSPYDRDEPLTLYARL